MGPGGNMEVQVGYKKIRKNGGRKSCVSVLNTLKGQKHRNFFKLRLWGFRLGPTAPLIFYYHLQ